jgi:hypothetical protein
VDPSLPWRCPVCGKINEDDAEFCVNCGTPRPSETEALSLSEPRQEPQEQALEEEAQEQEALAEPETAGEESEAQPAPAAEPPQQEEEPAETRPAETASEQPAEEHITLYLEVVNTPAHELLGKKIPLLFDVFPKITIGRSPESVIVIPDPTVSRRHAVIERVDGKIVLRDLGSTNGTYVYSPETGGFERVEEVELRPGMLLRLGESTILRVVAE